MAYFDPNFHSLEEYIVPPPTVSVDNDTYGDHTVVKVHSVNRQGILIDIVQALTDLDLIISKSTISVDGGYIMDAFHVTDELGNKLTEPAHIRYIQDSLLFAERRGGEKCRPPDEVKTCLNNLVGAGQLASDQTMLEMTVPDDHPGLLSEVLATLFNFSFEVNSSMAWTHNGRACFIFYIIDIASNGQCLISRLAELEGQLKRVVEAHCYWGGFKKWQMRISRPCGHTERRLHQMMQEENDWEGMANSNRGLLSSAPVVTAVEVDVSVNDGKKKRYVEVSVRSRDRPKLLFDIVCTLADLDYEVVHACVSTEESVAVLEYYIKKRDGWSRVTEMEKGRLVECLKAAIERRPGTWGMRVEVRVVEYRCSLLWEITRVFRENGLYVVGGKWAKHVDLAGGVFYVKGGSSSGDVARRLMQALCDEIGDCIFEIRESNN